MAAEAERTAAGCNLAQTVPLRGHRAAALTGSRATGCSLAQSKLRLAGIVGTGGAAGSESPGLAGPCSKADRTTVTGPHLHLHRRTGLGLRGEVLEGNRVGRKVWEEDARRARFLWRLRSCCWRELAVCSQTSCKASPTHRTMADVLQRNFRSHLKDLPLQLEQSGRSQSVPRP